SGYFVNLLKGFNVHIPEWLTLDYLSAYNAHNEVQNLTEQAISGLSSRTITANEAWLNAPEILGFKIIADLPALLIVFLITVLVYVGIRETKRATNAMVCLKVLVILAVIAIGFFYIAPENWSPFLPNGFSGMMKG